MLDIVVLIVYDFVLGLELSYLNKREVLYWLPPVAVKLPAHWACLLILLMPCKVRVRALFWMWVSVAVLCSSRGL